MNGTENAINISQDLLDFLAHNLTKNASFLKSIDPGFQWQHKLYLCLFFVLHLALSACLNLGIVVYEQEVNDTRRTLVNKVFNYMLFNQIL